MPQLHAVGRNAPRQGVNTHALRLLGELVLLAKMQRQLRRRVVAPAPVKPHHALGVPSLDAFHRAEVLAYAVHAERAHLRWRVAHRVIVKPDHSQVGQVHDPRP